MSFSGKLAAAIAALRNLIETDQFAHDLWRAYGEGRIDDATAQEASEALEARKRALRDKTPVRRSGVRKRREKVFGLGKLYPLDRNAKARILVRARAFMRRKGKGQAYGAITAKAYQVLAALLYQFHNSKTGKCFPSYERIAEHVGCCRDTVAEAIKALEACGLLTWVNTLKRVHIEGPALFGPARRGLTRVYRASNSYRLIDPMQLPKLRNPFGLHSKSDFPRGTNQPIAIQSFSPVDKSHGLRVCDPQSHGTPA